MALHRSVVLVDAYRENNSDTLEEIVVFKSGVAAMSQPPLPDMPELDGLVEVASWHDEPPTAREVIGWTLARAIDQQLVKHTWSALVSPRESAGASGVVGPSKTVLRARPSNLLGALWLEAAAAHSAQREVRFCAYSECTRAFELLDLSDPVSPTRRRTRRDRMYCSDKCQDDAYNAGKKRKRQS